MFSRTSHKLLCTSCNSIIAWWFSFILFLLDRMREELNLTYWFAGCWIHMWIRLITKGPILFRLWKFQFHLGLDLVNFNYMHIDGLLVVNVNLFYKWISLGRKFKIKFGLNLVNSYRPKLSRPYFKPWVIYRVQPFELGGPNFNEPRRPPSRCEFSLHSP